MKLSVVAAPAEPTLEALVKGELRGPAAAMHVGHHELVVTLAELGRLGNEL